MIEIKPVTFPAGTVRAAVAHAGDQWRWSMDSCSNGEQARDAAAMLSCEQIRCAGARPNQRECWRNYVAARKAGEAL